MKVPFSNYSSIRPGPYFDVDFGHCKRKARFDSGADTTVVPRKYLQYIADCKLIDTVEVRDFNGVVSDVNLYYGTIKIDGFEPITIEFIAGKKTKEILFGINILKYFTVTLEAASMTIVRRQK